MDHSSNSITCSLLTAKVAHRTGELCTLAEYQELRGNHKAFIHFCDNFLNNVYGRGAWKGDLRLKTLTEAVTESDEAFTLLVLQNNWEFWLDTTALHSAEEQDGRKIKRSSWTKMPKWTARSAYCHKNDGWDEQGIDRYNEIMELVLQNRQAHGELFNDIYKQHLRRKNDRLYDKMDRQLERPVPSKRAKVIMPIGIDAPSSVQTVLNVPNSVDCTVSIAATPSTLSENSRSRRSSHATEGENDTPEVSGGAVAHV